MPIGYRIDMAAINASAGAAALKMRKFIAAALDVHDGITKLGADAGAQATALVGMGYTQADAEAMVYEAGAMAEAALILSGQLGKPDPFNYVDLTANLIGIGQATS